jgi:N-acetylglucosaminyldiphosphoundecaprenol N-acetyl-beta-D-mannosaminyltransferase
MSLQTAQSDTPARAYVLGVRVDRVSQQQALDSIERMVAQRRESMNQLPCRQVVTVNTEFVMMAQRDSTFRQCINEAALVVADGMGIVWATRYLGTPAPERITGTDTGVAEMAARRLEEMAPGLRIAGCYAGSPAQGEEDEIIERIRVANADVLCVAYGAPAQELWIRRNLQHLPVAVAMGVGGAFDFLSGRQRRAPRAMQRMGLEWLYRLYREPWRWRRMQALPHFAIQVLLKGRNRE